MVETSINTFNLSINVSKRSCVIVDVWGYNSGRTRAIADLIASFGYHVIVLKVLGPGLKGGTDGDGKALFMRVHHFN